MKMILEDDVKVLWAEMTEMRVSCTAPYDCPLFDWWQRQINKKTRRRRMKKRMKKRKRTKRRM